MSVTTLWLSIVAIGVGTFVLRLSFIGLSGRLALPVAVTRALRFVPAAVLSAIILPAALRLPEGGLDVSIDNPRLIACVVAAGIAWATKSVLATLIVGMGTLWLLQALL
ncbi:AzlD domain-containing protein [Parvibaculum sp.]|uniref:AzlD domain-containing protein n=1 Tax=Parvibaculum sp. TaxID=2024848 RepID=UPI0034A0526A